MLLGYKFLLFLSFQSFYVVNVSSFASAVNLKQQQNCSANYKVYVYDIPYHLQKNAEQARQNNTYHVCKKCIYEQFALEYILYDHFLTHCGRTWDPEEADYFYLPIIREIDYRIALSSSGNRAPSLIEDTLLSALEKQDMTKWIEVFNVTDKYWRRSNGSDHILAMPAPVTNFRHQTNMRGFFHYVRKFACCSFFKMLLISFVCCL
jgi:hypothetical protein